MKTEYCFDKTTALGKIGKKIKTSVEFAGVPRGTTGKVIKTEAVGHSLLKNDKRDESYDLAIEWELPERCQPLVDWFSKNEYERFLIEVN